MARTAKRQQVMGLSLALAVVLGAAVLVAQGAFAPRRVPPDVPAPVVERLGPAPVKGDAAERYASLVSEGKYNAALAADPGGAYGWGDHFARIEDAEAFALEAVASPEGLARGDVDAEMTAAALGSEQS